MGLSVSFCGLTLPSPLVLASGVWGSTPEQLEQAALHGCGAVTTKSLGLVPTQGHPEPNIIEYQGGFLNAIGLHNPGVDEVIDALANLSDRLKPYGVALIASVFGDSETTITEVAHRVEKANPDFIELNLSCPNREGVMLAGDEAKVVAVTESVAYAVDTPIIVKLAPNVPDIGRIASVAVEFGASAICAVNTIPGMVLDENGNPVLSNTSGGISGPLLKPIALKAVYDIRVSCPSTPIIGVGGVYSKTDVLDMMSVGATVVGVGSVVLSRGPTAIYQITKELLRTGRESVHVPTVQRG